MNFIQTTLLLLGTACLCRTRAFSLERRAFLRTTATGFVIATPYVRPAPSLATGVSKVAVVQELKESKEKLEPIPDLLQAMEWDKVRSILKVPPVNKLWNLGDSQNIVLQLAKETGEVDLFELKDELASSLQMCDQLTYDNVFVYFQPGNGKVKIKEPQELARRAQNQLQQIIDLIESQ